MSLIPQQYFVVKEDITWENHILDYFHLTLKVSNSCEWIEYSIFENDFKQITDLSLDVLSKRVPPCDFSNFLQTRSTDGCWRQFLNEYAFISKLQSSMLYFCTWTRRKGFMGTDLESSVRKLQSMSEFQLMKSIYLCYFPFFYCS